MIPVANGISKLAKMYGFARNAHRNTLTILLCIVARHDYFVANAILEEPMRETSLLQAGNIVLHECETFVMAYRCANKRHSFSTHLADNIIIFSKNACMS